MIRSNVIRVSIIILAILTVIFLALACVQLFINPDFNFNNWYVAGLLAVFFVVQLICIVMEKFSIAKMGFYLLHIGILAFLLGNFMYFVKGYEFYSYLPVDKITYSNVPSYLKEKDDFVLKEHIELGFAIGVNSFKVTKYEDNAKIDKWYEAEIIGSEQVVGKGNKNKILSVNNPLRVGKYKIYLMDYDPLSQSFITLLYKYDPGEYISTTGIIMIISGTFIICFYKKSTGRTKE